MQPGKAVCRFDSVFMEMAREGLMPTRGGGEDGVVAEKPWVLPRGERALRSAVGPKNDNYTRHF